MFRLTDQNIIININTFFLIISKKIKQIHIYIYIYINAFKFIYVQYLK